MTDQVQRYIEYEEFPFKLIWVRGEGLVDPGSFGFQVHWRTTACQEGYWCRLAVRDGWLRLLDLEIQLPDDWTERLRVGINPPTIFGEVPRLVGDGEIAVCGNARLENVDVSVPFTGSMMIGAEWREDVGPIHGSPQRWHFRKVRELRFGRGRLDSVEDRS